MLPDKKTWTEQFVDSDVYKQIVQQIDLFPNPDFVPVWNFRAGWPNVGRRHNIYLRRLLPLQAFYIIDYIDKQTNGGHIVNLTGGPNYFAGMYNITNWLGKTTLVNQPPLSVLELEHKDLSFDNTICICEVEKLGLVQLESVINNIVSITKNYGYVAFDSVELKNNTPKQFMIDNNITKYYKLVMFIDEIVDRLSDKVDIIEYENIMEDLEEGADNLEPFDGDIRILFRTKTSTKV